MAYIAPNTIVKLISGCPLDNSYTHTIYFATQAAQTAYFESIVKTGYVFEQQYYQRVNKNTIRLQCKADLIYDCNYMMFKNASHVNMWFYAFILEVNYISENVAELVYEIDVMQTWHFFYSRNRCLVERNHASNDAIGANIVPENIELGEYVLNSYGQITHPDLCVVIAVADYSQTGYQYDGIYSGCRLFVYAKNDTAGIAAKLAEYNQAPEAIVAMYMIPLWGMGNVIPTSHIIPSGEPFFEDTTGLAINNSTLIDTYAPHNKKLLTYPYNFYHVENGSGEELNLRFEFFKDLTPRFRAQTTFTRPVQTVLRPKAYKRMQYEQGISETVFMGENITLADYPLCSWSFDAYQAWIAQNSVPIAINAIGRLGTNIVGALASNASIPLQTPQLNTLPAPAVNSPTVTNQGFGYQQPQASNVNLPMISPSDSALHVLTSMYKASIAADICKGSISNGNVDAAHNMYCFYGARMSITADMARRIDSFFDLYGYAVNEVTAPQIACRKHYTYVKTNGITIHGYLPGDDIRKIESIYNKGITFWRNGSEVGDYSVAADNTPFVG